MIEYGNTTAATGRVTRHSFETIDMAMTLLPERLRRYMRDEAPYFFDPIEFLNLLNEGWSCSEIIRATQASVAEDTSRVYGHDHPESLTASYRYQQGNTSAWDDFLGSMNSE